MRKIVLSALAIAVLLTVACARERVKIPSESVYTGPSLPVFLNPILAQHVDRRGLVNYPSLQEDTRFELVLAYFAGTRPDQLSSPEAQLAYWINAYNAFALQAVLDHYPMDYVPQSWSKQLKFNAGGRMVTLDEIQTQIIPKFKEPRARFALSGGAISSPPLRAEAYQPEILDSQLQDQGNRYMQENPRRNHFAAVTRTLYLSRVFEWFNPEFGGTSKLAAFLLPYLSPDHQEVLKSTATSAPAPSSAPASAPATEAAPASGTTLAQEGYNVKVEFLPFDVTLNDQRSRDARERLLPYGTDINWTRK